MSARRSILIWVFAGTISGSGVGALAGTGVGLLFSRTVPIWNYVFLILVLALYGALVGGLAGLPGGFIMGLLDRFVGEPRLRAVTAAVLGLSGGLLLEINELLPMAATGSLGCLAGCISARLVAYIRVE